MLKKEVGLFRKGYVRKNKGYHMKKRQKAQFRYYEMAEREVVLALMGEEWIREYGKDIDELHFHNYLEVGICYDGEGEVVLGEEVYAFQKGDLIIIPPYFLHTTNSIKGTVAYWEWFYFDVESMIQSIQVKHSTEFNDIKQRIYRNAHYIKDKKYETLKKLIEHIREECLKKQYLYEESVKGLATSFLIEIMRLNDGEKERFESNILIYQAIQYVEEHFGQVIYISDLANACNMSESHFRKVFEHSMNMKPLDFIHLVRIQKACHLMQWTEKSMKDIAYQSGFDTLSTFNRNFRRMLGTTPYQWKKSAQNYQGKLKECRISAYKGW